jgi:tRNA G10  N-methylase Trm11
MTFREEHISDSVRLICGDCREVLPTLGRVDHIITDPPYGLKTHVGMRSANSLDATIIDFAAITGSDLATLAKSPAGA